MNIICSREKVVFCFFPFEGTLRFYISVVNYSLGCKEVYVIVILFFSPEADGPKKYIVRL